MPLRVEVEYSKSDVDLYLSQSFAIHSRGITIKEFRESCHVTSKKVLIGELYVSRVLLEVVLS